MTGMLVAGTEQVLLYFLLLRLWTSLFVASLCMCLIPSSASKGSGGQFLLVQRCAIREV
jgi:hypothetical protein